MSAPLAIELERELGALPKWFTSVGQIVRWYRASRERKQGGAMNLWNVGGPSSAAERARAQMTYARIVPCLGPQHHADYEDEPLAVNALDKLERGRPISETPEQEAERRVSEVAAWCEVVDGETGQANISDRLNFQTVEGCSSYMRYTMRVLRRRFVAVGLLVEGD